MAKYTEYREKGFIANAALSTEYVIVAHHTTAGEIVIANAQTLPIVGILKQTGVAGDVLNVVMPQEGTFKVKCGAAGVAINTYVTADSNGLAVATTSAGDMVIGRALQAGSSGDIIEIQLMYFRY